MSLAVNVADSLSKVGWPAGQQDHRRSNKLEHMQNRRPCLLVLRSLLNSICCRVDEMTLRTPPTARNMVAQGHGFGAYIDQQSKVRPNEVEDRFRKALCKLLDRTTAVAHKVSDKAGSYSTTTACCCCLSLNVHAERA